MSSLRFALPLAMQVGSKQLNAPLSKRTANGVLFLRPRLLLDIWKGQGALAHPLRLRRDRFPSSRE